tara:strand:- start:35747 stop:36463 length:717 start_codon:yes stop_codon:yes gene_type:complete
MKNPYAVVKDFESALCEYTGASYAVAVNSCTAALTLAVAWHFTEQQRKADGEAIAAGHGMKMIALRPPIDIPKRTYVSVPMAIIHAGGRPTFRDEDWLGAYQLKPLDVYDCARRFTQHMYCDPVGDWADVKGARVWMGNLGIMQCVSFHASKILGDTQGGAILHDSAEADAWLRRARFDGRTEGVPPKDDKFTQIGWHCYMSPDVAARLLLKLYSLPAHNDPLPNDPYPDLSTMEIFK